MIYSRARNDDFIYRWDLRKPDIFEQKFRIKDNICQQRLYFDIKN